MVKTQVEKFEDYKIEDGEFLGLANDEWYKLEDIIRYGNGETIIRYYDDGELVSMVQREGRYYRNDRIYG